MVVRFPSVLQELLSFQDRRQTSYPHGWTQIRSNVGCRRRPQLQLAFHFISRVAAQPSQAIRVHPRLTWSVPLGQVETLPSVERLGELSPSPRGRGPG